MTAGPPSVAIRGAAMLPSSDEGIRGRSGADGVTAAGSGVAAMAASFTSALATGASVSAAEAGAAGVSAMPPSRGFRFRRFGLHRLVQLQRGQFLRLSRRLASGTCPAGAGISEAAQERRSRDILRRLLRDRRIDAQQRQRRRRVDSAGQTSARASAVARGGWQIPHARRAAARRRQAQKSGSTSTGRWQ